MKNTITFSARFPLDDAAVVDRFLAEVDDLSKSQLIITGTLREIERQMKIKKASDREITDPALSQ